MKRSYEQVNEGGNENNRENEPANREQWIKDISSHLEEDRARDQEHKGSIEDTEEKPSMMNEDQIAMIYNLCRDRVPFQHIENIMGVSEHKVDYPEFERVMVEASLLIRKEEEWAGKTAGQPEALASSEEFQDYDPVRWEMAATGARGDSSLYEEEDKSGWVRTKSPIPEASAPASEADFVRAVRNCRLGNKPYFRKGDILRVINKARRSGLSDEQFEVLPLRPPGEAGIVKIRDFEPSDRAAAEEVGREARGDKELDSYQYAMEWED